MSRGAVLLTVVAGLAACGRLGFEGRAPDDGGGGSGAGDAAGDAPADAATRPNVAFLTSIGYPATLGGLVGADAICQSHAEAVGLPGTFGALLGDATLGPADALAGSRGWVDPTGAPIVDLPATWVDGSMEHPLRRDESGAQVAYARVWFGARGEACLSWSIADPTFNPSVVLTDNPFTEFAVTSGCDGQARLACVERGNVHPLTFPTTAGRRAFVTLTGWTPGGGLAGADAHCQAAAGAQSIPGTYLALLSTGAGHPSDRIPVIAGTWIRLDGQLVTPTVITGNSNTYLEAFLQRANGSAPIGASAFWAWMGAPGSTCGDWLSTSATGHTGDASSAWLPNFYSRQDALCTEAHPLVCFES